MPSIRLATSNVPHRFGLPALLLSVALVGDTGTAQAEDPTPTSSAYLGFEPRVMRESWYASNEFNVSVIPLVANISLAKQIGLRVKPTVFWHFGGESSQPAVSLVGAYVAPTYYSHGAQGATPYGKFFIGPSTEISRDRIESMWHLTIAADGGYAFALSDRLNFVLSGQVGYSWFSKKERGGDVHIGIFPSLGLWL